ncbi:hypothetical protein QM467_18620 [Rhodoblastus sp. 17X3]|uniref:hypothetical protein n=1 Tax=Rhodoblastus sp. 17X3 TaxID=3047026 RepID=UPI0024B845FA|nr:hypothetical protein [Rhodoblastus sp. 17X3]MDI9850053.1 hypothetical protein [Rhodoblastus sp. 17X3]
MLERDEQIAEWARLAEKVAQPLGGKQPAEKGISKAARDLGLDRDDARRAVKVDSLTPEANVSLIAAS